MITTAVRKLLVATRALEAVGKVHPKERRILGEKKMDIPLLGNWARCAVVFVCAVASTPVYSVTLDFFCLTNSVAADCATGVSQLSVDVTDAGSGQVLFTFENTGPNASSIADVYFDDGSLLGIASLIDADDGIGGDAGVDFSVGASPMNLPSGNNAAPPFQATVGFLADSDPPVQPNGVNPGEWLGILFDLQGGQTFADVLTELGNGDLRIGLHVQGLSGGSESFINNPVPLPAAVWLFGSGLLGLIGMAKRKKA